MALIKCTECGSQVSDKAERCPQCGCPISVIIEHIENKKAERKLKIENAKQNFCCWKCGGSEFTFAKGSIMLCGKCPSCGAMTEICELDDIEDTDIPDGIFKVDTRLSIECPYCHSTNTKKISGSSRVASFLTFGLAGKKVGKQWHCNKCGSDF